MLFLETVCLLHGEIQNEPSHRERMRQTAAYYGFNAPPLPELHRLLPHTLREGKVKCRVLYCETIREINFERYLPKKISSLKLIEANVDYPFKLADREALNALLAHKGDCDEILITRNGLVTDTSYSNVAFSRGERFFTPDTPLLNGTKRQKLLREGVIAERRIHRDDILKYDRIFQINALLDLDDAVSLPTSHIMD